MYNWQCRKCGYMTESERCPSCKYSNCRGCHILVYANKPPEKCPLCKEERCFFDLDKVAESGGK